MGIAYLINYGKGEDINVNSKYFLMQVMEVVKRWPEVHKISFVAHSLVALLPDMQLGDSMNFFLKWNLQDFPGTVQVEGI